MKFKRVFVQGHTGSPCLDPHFRGLCSGIWQCLFPQGRNPWCQGDVPSRTHSPFRRTQIAPNMLLRFAQASDFLGELCQWCMPGVQTEFRNVSWGVHIDICTRHMNRSRGAERRQFVGQLSSHCHHRTPQSQGTVNPNLYLPGHYEGIFVKTQE